MVGRGQLRESNAACPPRTGRPAHARTAPEADQEALLVDLPRELRTSCLLRRVTEILMADGRL
jgi:hypothetical protein